MKDMTKNQARAILDFVDLCERLGVKRLGPSDEVVKRAEIIIKKGYDKFLHSRKG